MARPDVTFVPHTDADRAEMLRRIGVKSMEGLFAQVPEAIRFPELDLPPALSEIDVQRELQRLSDLTVEPGRVPCFLGAGCYQHFRPATVDFVLQRSELYTSYTPYQPELSQGMLQAIFEYQSMICRLTGMEISNASHYDGATALAEAVLLALNVSNGRRDKIILSPGVHPKHRQVVRTYLRGNKAQFSEADDTSDDLAALVSMIDDNTAALVVQSPDFFGGVKDLRGLAESVNNRGALLIVATDPIALGLFRAPGEDMADIVVAEGQPLGIPMSFGGPHLGIFATRRDHLRRLPGRLVGETVDAAGRRGYVLTLATREQHIRRAKATSNICTNAALSALAAAVYLATMGKTGLRQVAKLCYDRSNYAAQQIAALPSVSVNPQAPDQPFFREFVVKLPSPVDEMNDILFNDFGILGGYDLGQDYPNLPNHMLIAVTEMTTRAEIDRLVNGLRRATA